MIHSLPTTLEELQSRLEQLRHARSLNDNEAFIAFHVKVLPALLGAERCSIFLFDPVNNQAWLKYGTGLQEKQILAPMEGSVVGEVISTGQGVIANQLHRRPGFHQHADSTTGFVTTSIVCAPIQSVVNGTVTGAVQILNKLEGEFSTTDLQLLTEAAHHLALGIEHLIIDGEIAALTQQLQSELDFFQGIGCPGGEIIAASKAMRDVVEMAKTVSSSPVDLFLNGENGTGKEVIARLIHYSSRRNQPFVAINCASIPENLLESEFFGYEKGAFTGADQTRKGRFEEAAGGTLFLDEVGELPLSLQPKLLRVIQEREGSRLGSNKLIPYNFRLISATNQNLKELIAQRAFRSDLFYRLYSVEIAIPPLRERRADIIPMAWGFLNATRHRFGKWVSGFSQQTITLFENYDWPGNVRQLHHEVERLVALTPENQEISAELCSRELQNHRCLLPPTQHATLPELVQKLEIELITKTLEIAAGNKLQAARQLGITRQGLYKKLVRYGLEQ